MKLQFHKFGITDSIQVTKVDSSLLPRGSNWTPLAGLILATCCGGPRTDCFLKNKIPSSSVKCSKPQAVRECSALNALILEIWRLKICLVLDFPAFFLYTAPMSSFFKTCTACCSLLYRLSYGTLIMVSGPGPISER